MDGELPECRRIGVHNIADLTGIQPSSLNCATDLMDMMRDALLTEGFTIIAEKVHQFGAPGHGVTGLFLLTESHAAFHSYPELGYLGLDVFSCGSRDGGNIIATLTGRLGAEVKHHTVERLAILPVGSEDYSSGPWMARAR